MKFRLEIELGITAEGMIQTGNDVLQALTDSLKGEESLPLEESTGGRLWDVYGNTVGTWKVSE